MPYGNIFEHCNKIFPQLQAVSAACCGAGREMQIFYSEIAVFVRDSLQ
jgi:hypothetical protein